jgi:hypothetical protein
MIKSSDFIEQFSNLNNHIVEAITNKDFARVINLDIARQSMMRDLCLLASEEVNDRLFEFLENCSVQNTKMIEEMEFELEQMTFKNNKFEKAVKAYSN